MQLPDLSLLLVAAVFWATYFLLKATVFKPLGTILEEREETIGSAATALEAALAKQETTAAEVDRRLTEARREALAVREAARARAATKRAELLEAARDEARRATLEAQRRLEEEIGAARADLRTDARQTALELASFVLGRKVA